VHIYHNGAVLWIKDDYRPCQVQEIQRPAIRK
jgi:hypothetical protein